MKFKTQSEMFLHIWSTRPHVSELTGKPLLHIGHFKWGWQFTRASKGKLPKL